MGNLTKRQYRYWVQQQLTPSQPVQRVLAVVPITSAQAPLLAEAWAHVARYIDSVRAILRVENGVPSIEFTDTFRPLDRFELEATEDVPKAISELLATEWALFPVDSFLIKQGIVRCANGETFRISTGSHLVCDGISHDLLSQHITRVLHQLESGIPPAPIDVPSFEASMAIDLAEEAKSPTPSSDSTLAAFQPLPFFGETVSREEQRKQRAVVDLSLEETNALIHAAREAPFFYKSVEATLANLFTALIAAWTWHHSHTTDFSVGVPFHGRRADERDLIGFKSENLSLPITINPTASFSELVKQVHERASEALKSRGYSVANSAHAPTYQVASNFRFQRVEAEASPPDSLPTPLELPQIAGDPESVFFMQLPSMKERGAFRLVLAIKEPLLARTTLEFVLEGIVNALRAVIRSPDLPVAQLPISDLDWSRSIALQAHAQTSTPRSELFTHWQAAMGKSPHGAAVALGDTVVTHQALWQRAEQIAYALVHDYGLKPDDRVMVHADNSIELVAVYLATIASGATYVPVQPDVPSAVLQNMVEQLQPSLVVSDAATLPERADVSMAELASTSGPPFPLRDQPAERSAHIFHTSGTTGSAKAIVVSHGALGTSLHAFLARLSLEPGARIYANYAPTFDPWLTAVFAALWHGGTFYLPTSDSLANATALADFIREHNISTVCTPTAYFHALAIRAYPQLKRWVIGGEPLSRDKADKFLAANQHSVALLNAYGPTETTIWGTVADVREDPPPSVGYPLPSIGTRVASPCGTPTPRGMPGELWISGVQLANGYFSEPKETLEHFVLADGLRWYRTGDLVRRSEDGQLEFLGRLDRQVKIRGHRVEPKEVEDALVELLGVEQARVVAVKRNQQQKLVAYLVTVDGTLPETVVVLKTKLLHQLAEYKVPTWFVAVNELPRNANGKVNDQALPPPTTSHLEDADRMPSLTAWDLRIVFEQVLGLDRVRVDDDFFDLGGDSLALIELLNVIEAHFGKQIDAAAVLGHPTVGGLAPLLEQDRQEAASLTLNLRDGTEPTLFCIPGGGGIGVEFYPLSRRAPLGQPVVVLRSSGTDGHQHPPRTPQDLIDEHVRHIQIRTHPNQAIYLVGYSIGGAIACAVAHKLVQEGWNVARIFLIDSIHPQEAKEQRRRQTSLKQRGLSIISRDKTIDAYARQLDDARTNSQIMAAADLGEYNRLAQYQLYLQLDLHPLTCALTYFRARGELIVNDTSSWSTLSPSFEIVDVPGEHTGDKAVVREPFVGALAQALFERIEREE